MAKKTLGERLRVTSGNFLFFVLLTMFADQGYEAFLAEVDIASLPEGGQEVEYAFDVHDVVNEPVQEELKEANEIPALVNPEVRSIDDAPASVDGTNGVVVTAADGSSRYYPEYLLWWHLAINDEIGGQPVGIVYSPTIDFVQAFPRESDQLFVDGGNVWKSVHLFYDTRYETYWSPVHAEGVAGPRLNADIEPISFQRMSFDDYSAQYPDGKVAAASRFVARNYSYNPYAGDQRTGQPIIQESYSLREPPSRERGVMVLVDDQPVEFVVGVGEQRVFLETGELVIVVDEFGGVEKVSGFDGADVDLATVPEYVFTLLREADNE